MKIIKYLNNSNFTDVKKFIDTEGHFYDYFIKLGWTVPEIKKNFEKQTNYSIGYFDKNKLKALLFGDIIKYNNKLELEIFVIYVSHKYRRKKVATSLMNFIETNKKISKIFLEVDADNHVANSFYEKNSFVFLKFRHNYYKNKNKFNKAKCYIKNLNNGQ